MANSYLNFDFSDSLTKALERNEQRKQRFNDNVDSILSNVGDATKTALIQHQRNKVIKDFGGDANDPELKLAKEIYRTSGDPSALLNYEQARKQAALSKYNNELAAKSNADAKAAAKAIEDADKSKERAIRKQELYSKLNAAKAAYDDASKGGVTPSNAIKVALDDAKKSLVLEFPEEAKNIYKIEESQKTTEEPKAEEHKGVNRRKFVKQIIDFETDGNIVDNENIGALLAANDDLFNNNEQTEAEYKELRTRIKAINPTILKAKKDAETEATNEQHAKQSYLQGQADRAESKARQRKADAKQEAKDAEEEKLKKEEEDKYTSMAKSWLAENSSNLDGSPMTNNDLLSVLGFVKDKKLVEYIKKERGL